MAIDSRRKGCPNNSCKLNIEKIRQRPDIDYCPKCGTRLVYVCRKCFCEIEDLGLRHKVCDRCEAREDEKKHKLANGAKNIGGMALKTAGSAVVAVVVPVAGRLLKDTQKQIVDTMVRVIDEKIKKE